MPVIGDKDVAISAEEEEHIRCEIALAQCREKDISSGQTIVANIRHYEALKNAYQSLDAVLMGIDGAITTDLIALELKRALAYLGEISGEVTNDRDTR
jgi:tRNA modification GTPase